MLTEKYITLEKAVVKLIEVTKFLAVSVDQHLSWKHRISFVARKVSITIGPS